MPTLRQAYLASDIAKADKNGSIPNPDSHFHAFSPRRASGTAIALFVVGLRLSRETLIEAIGERKRM
jgi:hypothetical protein